MKKQASLVLTLLVLVGGCSTPGSDSQRWAGADIDEVIRELGAPANRYRSRYDGRRIYVWDDEMRRSGFYATGQLEELTGNRCRRVVQVDDDDQVHAVQSWGRC